MNHAFISFAVAAAAAACAVAVTAGGVINAPAAPTSTRELVAMVVVHPTSGNRHSVQPEPCAGFPFFR
jgi:hypothetical protein